MSYDVEVATHTRPVVDARPEGVFVRLGEPPRAKLPRLALPPELVQPR
jgi:hypothetical protein